MKNKPSSSAPFTFFTGIVPSCSFINKSLVFLGTGECGKSSFVRQLLSGTTNKVNDKNLKIHSEHIQYTIFQNLMNIATNAQIRKNITGDDEKIVEQLAHLVENYVDSHFERRHLEVLLKNGKNFIKLLKNPIIRDVIDNPELYSIIHLTGNHQYFFENSERILVSNSYEPTLEDMTRLQKKTVGIINCGSIEFNKFKLTITDTGGQRNERKKWKHVISANPPPDAIFFMVSLSECFQNCYEDQSQNRANESLNCFKDIISSTNVPIFLIFTKLDILEEIIQRQKVVFSSLFPEFVKSSDHADQVKDFLISRFVQTDSNKRVKGIHIINTLNRQDVEKTAEEILNSL